MESVNVNTTGVPGLDRVVEGILPGDNIVWQVDAIHEYKALVLPFAEAARRNRRQLIYFRFASHEALLPDDFGAEVCELDAQQGFETFIEGIHDTIESAGRGAFYVFDCLSELAVDWYSDPMLGNFFMLTCPFLYELETVTYFALFRGHHSSRAITPITETTQLFLNVYEYSEELYIHPIKVEWRFTPRMNMLHVWRGEEVSAVTSSAVIADILRTEPWSGMGEVAQPGFWERTLLRGEDCLQRAEGEGAGTEDPEEIRLQLIRMCVSRDERILPLAVEHLSLADVIDIRKRMVGSGLIGGKAVGMLLARAILKHEDDRFKTLLETHDSFYVGSDVFYTFLVQNGIWQTRRKQYSPDTFLDGADEARQVILSGRFPDYIVRQFESVLDYFGQSPFIVRSSSLLEDNYGNSFAGKYESVFCTNQGSRRMRTQQLLSAVRRVYASTMSEEALTYRARRGLLHQDEQMALLVQRVSGAMHGNYHYPQVAGVGFSFNPYVWSEHIDPKAGVIRLVFGLGTRAVDRADDDYTRIVALNAPERRPEADAGDVMQHAQRRVDLLDLESNQFASIPFDDVAAQAEDVPLELFTTPVRVPGRPRERCRVLTFDPLLKDTAFVQDMRDMLRILAEGYEYPVDIEFTANTVPHDGYRINLVQCRPLQTQGAELISLPEVEIDASRQLFKAQCSVIGQSRIVNVHRICYIVPDVYGQLPIPQRHSIARAVAKINRAEPLSDDHVLMLIGPGRWGTSSPELGVPVNFAEINRSHVICEMARMRDDFAPDLSLGTHFLNELVEMNMLYIAVHPRQQEYALNEETLLAAPNRLSEVVPDAAQWAECIRLLNAEDLAPDGGIKLYADCVKQSVVMFVSAGD